MLVTIKLGYIEEEAIDSLVDLLEIPKSEVVQLLISKILKDKELLDKLLS